MTRGGDRVTSVGRPRVALVAHDIHDGGGMERAFAELIRHAHSRFAFDVFAADLAPELRPLVTWHRIRVPRRPFPLKLVAFFARAAIPVARADVDLVHVLGAIVPNRADVVTVQYCHAAAREKATGAADVAGLARRLNTRLTSTLSLVAERFCYRRGRAGTMACVSSGVETELHEHYPSLPVARTPNGVAVTRFRPDDRVRDRVRLEEGVDGVVVCLFVGGDWGRKGLALAVAALARVDDSLDLRLWVVGGGDERRFEELSEESGVGSRVRFFGHRDDAERYFQAADIFVLPTAYEAAPLVLYEAAASSLPIVVTAVNGVEDVVVDGESGLLVERDPDAVAVALSALARNPGLRRRIGEEARRRASEFTWDRSAAEVIALYERLLDGAEELAA